MSDLFNTNLTDEVLDQIFAVMAICPQHTFQIVTKRPDRMLAYCSDDASVARIFRAADAIALSLGAAVQCGAQQKDDGLGGFCLPNVWLGVSVENQAAADERIPLLLQTPAAVRFLSCEPLLGLVNLESVPLPDAYLRMNGIAGVLQPLAERESEPDDYRYFTREGYKIDWVICGGESGPCARPMHPDWARSLRDQCAAAGVPFFFKQWGEWLGQMQDGAPSGDQHLNCMDTPIRVGKKAAGDLLDGKQWHQFPR